jgi:hypothetical protein
MTLTLIQNPVSHSRSYQYSYYFKGSPGVWQTYDSPAYSVISDTRTTGPNYKDWRERIRKGQDATTYLHGRRWYTKNLHIGRYDQKPGPYWFGMQPRLKVGHLFDVNWAESMTGLTSLQSDVDNLAKAVTAKRANKLTSQFQGGVFIGELLETLHQIRNPAETLRKGITRYHEVVVKRLRRGNALRDSKLAGRVLGDTWLESVFGWLPLISDIEDGAKALARYNLDEYRSRTKVIGSSTGKLSEEDPYWSNLNFGYGGYETLLKTTAEIKVVYRVGVAATPHSQLEMSSGLFGWRWEDFIPTVWELIPYSFLVDYFANIGDVLSAWSHQNFGQTWASKTVIKTVDRSIAGQRLNSAAKSALLVGQLDEIDFDKYNVTRRYKEVVRDHYTGDFVPSLAFEVPGIGSLKWINIGALGLLRTINGL